MRFLLIFLIFSFVQNAISQEMSLREQAMQKAMAEVPKENLLELRIELNEAAAIGTLRVLGTSQPMFQMNNNVDQDEDGFGEYGYIQELSGIVNLRGTKRKVKYIAADLGETAQKNGGIAQKNGYYFLCYLAAVNDYTAETSPLLASKDQAIIDKQERSFIVYAWPTEYGKTGERVFVIDQSALVLGAKNKKGTYSGQNKPNFDAAFTKMRLRSGKGNDGQGWYETGSGRMAHEFNKKVYEIEKNLKYQKEAQKLGLSLEQYKKIKKCQDNLVSIYYSARSFETSWRIYPVPHKVKFLTMLRCSPNTLLCPSTNDKNSKKAIQNHDPNCTSYEATQVFFDKYQKDFLYPVAWDKKGNHGNKRNVVFHNGSVKNLSEEEFQKLMPQVQQKVVENPKAYKDLFFGYKRRYLSSSYLYKHWEGIQDPKHLMSKQEIENAKIHNLKYEKVRNQEIKRRRQSSINSAYRKLRRWGFDKNEILTKLRNLKLQEPEYALVGFTSAINNLLEQGEKYTWKPSYISYLKKEFKITDKQLVELKKMTLLAANEYMKRKGRRRGEGEGEGRRRGEGEGRGEGEDRHRGEGEGEKR